MLFRSDIWHGAAENVHPEGKKRYIMQIHYGNRYISSQLPDIRTPGAYSAEVRSQLTRRQEQLLGKVEPWYRQGSYNIPPFADDMGIPKRSTMYPSTYGTVPQGRL